MQTPELPFIYLTMLLNLLTTKTFITAIKFTLKILFYRLSNTGTF